MQCPFLVLFCEVLRHRRRETGSFGETDVANDHPSQSAAGELERLALFRSVKRASRKKTRTEGARRRDHR